MEGSSWSEDASSFASLEQTSLCQAYLHSPIARKQTPRVRVISTYEAMKPEP